MRNMLLASATLFGLAVAAPAFAQTQTTPPDTSPQGATPPATMAPGNTAAQPGVGQSDTTQAAPNSSMATPPGGGNTEATGTTTGETGTMPKHRMHAAAGTVPPLPADGSPQHYLTVAQDALRAHRGREAEDALERAETRLLDRATPASAANEPDTMPAIQQISQARQAIAKRDWQQAAQLIDSTLKTPALMSENSGAGMSGTTGTSAGAGMSATPAVGSSSSGASPASPMPMATPPAGGGAPSQ